MPNTLVVSVGSDMKNRGKFYWDIKNASTRDVIHVRMGFNSLDDAMASLEEFKRDLAQAVVVRNPSRPGQ